MRYVGDILFPPQAWLDLQLSETSKPIDVRGYWCYGYQEYLSRLTYFHLSQCKLRTDQRLLICRRSLHNWPHCFPWKHGRPSSKALCLYFIVAFQQLFKRRSASWKHEYLVRRHLNLLTIHSSISQILRELPERGHISTPPDMQSPGASVQKSMKSAGGCLALSIHLTHTHILQYGQMTFGAYAPCSIKVAFKSTTEADPQCRELDGLLFRICCVPDVPFIPASPYATKR